MASGVGIEIKLDENEYREIIEALSKAAAPELADIYKFIGEELARITTEAFEMESNPATGEKWAAIKPRSKSAKNPGSTSPILDDSGDLKRSLHRELIPGGVIFGSNKKYARIHQMGGEAGRGRKANITARPYLGVPDDFVRNLMDDPAILKKLGLMGD